MIALWLAAALASTGLSGHVLDAEGRPQAAVTVSAGGKQTQTDADGAWRLEVEPGEVTVRVALPGAPAAEITVAVVAGLTTELLLTEGSPPQVSLEAPAATLAAYQDAFTVYDSDRDGKLNGCGRPVQGRPRPPASTPRA